MTDQREWFNEVGAEPPNGNGAAHSRFSETPAPLLSMNADGSVRIPPRIRRLPVMRFGSMPTPAPREYVLEGLIPEGCCSTIYGDGGVAKSMLAMSLSISLALGKERWMGRKIQPQGVCYMDFELSADEQHRRAKALTAGAGRTDAIPDSLMYLQGMGHSAEEAFATGYEAMHEASATFLVVDSYGLALQGEASSDTDIIAFNRAFLEPFVEQGYAVLLIDHQAKGGVYQRATSFGSVYKRNLVRSELQIQALEQDEHAGTLDLIFRHTKHNFGPLSKPLGAQVVFAQDQIQVNMADVPGRVLAQEDGTKPTDRVRLVLPDGGPDGITVRDVADATGMQFKVTQRALNQLVLTGELERDGIRYHQVHKASWQEVPAAHERGEDAAYADEEVEF